MTPPPTDVDEEESVREKVLSSQDRRQRAGRILLVGVLLYLVASNVWTQVTAEEAQVTASQATDDKETAQRQAKSLAEQVAEACAKGGEAAAELGPAACTEARDVQQDPVVNDVPEDGADGSDGRGITGTTIADGRLMISYTDGTVEDKGVVTGEDGEPGRGIVTSSITPAGRLVLAYSDGSTEDVGPVVGPGGTNGTDGRDGRGVVSVTVSTEYHLIVTYDDGSTADAGPLPAGPPGRGIVSVAFDFDTCVATVSYTDDTEQQAPMTGCRPSDPPPEPLLPLPGG